MRRASLALLLVFLSGATLSQEGTESAPGARPPVVPGPGPALPPDGPLEGLEEEEKEIVLVYSADRRLAVNGRPVLRADLEACLRALYRPRRHKTLWLSGAGSLRYGEVAEVIEAARRAGVERVGVVTPGMGQVASR